jgi:1,4-dihydroxy-2-naphthoyl-CoA hydrolase
MKQKKTILNPAPEPCPLKMYTYQTKIKLHQTDAAGLLFFSHQFEIVHDAYESLLEKIGFGFASLIREKDFFLPIIHAECEYKAPLFVEDLIEIQVKVEKVGKTSFTFVYKLVNSKGILVGTARTTHVTMNKETQKKITLPSDMRVKITELYEQDNSSTSSP